VIDTVESGASRLTAPLVVTVAEVPDGDELLVPAQAAKVSVRVIPASAIRVPRFRLPTGPFPPRCPAAQVRYGGIDEFIPCPQHWKLPALR
jgi:hypothetical protein